MIWFAALAAYQVAQSYQQGEMIRANARLKQRIDDMNAERAELDAYYAQRDGFSDIARYQSVIDQTVSAQRAGYAAQNVDVSYGSAAELQNETRHVGILNQLEMERRAREKAMGLKNEARNIRLGSTMSGIQAGQQASAQESQGWFNAAQTGLSGYYNYRDSGAGDSDLMFSKKTSTTESQINDDPFYGTGPRGSDGGYSEYPKWWRK